jgi:hypothetical protein
LPAQDFGDEHAIIDVHPVTAEEWFRMDCQREEEGDFEVWGGNRTWVGAYAQAVLMSVCRTCWQRGQNAIYFLSQLLRRYPPIRLGLPS